MSLSCQLVLVLLLLSETNTVGVFQDASHLLPPDTVQLNYGVAVANVGEGKGPMEWIVAGFSGPNIVLQLNETTGKYKNIAQIGTPYEALRDPQGAAIGVCACDIDGDGLEEIYFLNTNDRYSGPKIVKDKLFKWRNGRYEDLFVDDINKHVSSMFAGRSVACVDRKGTGKYGILLATYAEGGSGKFGLIEMDESNPGNDARTGYIVLHNVAEAVGIDFSTGGRGIAVGPVIGSDGFSDIYFVNEGNFRLGNRGDNALFKNDGQGHFMNIANDLKLDDLQPGRGVALADFNNDEKTDIVYGNWMGPHRLQLQTTDARGSPVFTNVASTEFASPSPIRTVIAADFDNDGTLSVFMNNIVYYNMDSSNRLFKAEPANDTVTIISEDIGDAIESNQHGTGAAVADINGDGLLDLLVAHGESKAQALSYYQVSKSRSAGNNWLRILPLTQFGAPARGARVTVTLENGVKLTRIIDGGSGYLCEMEPVSHFGLGKSWATVVKITWPDSHTVTKALSRTDINNTYKVSFLGEMHSANSQPKDSFVQENYNKTVAEVYSTDRSEQKARFLQKSNSSSGTQNKGNVKKKNRQSKQNKNARKYSDNDQKVEISRLKEKSRPQNRKKSSNRKQHSFSN
ncbi:Cartilage acidic protein 1 [Bulinus truncatus]|nr:Cartilage acidic protein 1 [Bulinus truncatus]